ncbi:transcriptional regulator GcvA [Pelagibius litoralis]|uniref:Transcriptional regulator GcvA n=1 Tax=Pelagibius litoralis TaxID=374515 RepID=A0A967C392_9PROT|nr:transcriptional regulator GcvA [Pelagibius litoralis]NIA68948.1 transcriptional regulator GcvA [Pelagibius litoralis]
MKELPPLNALRAFEAGARHLSFTKAAEELHVTQAAVSHQVKALETHLGFPLFKRLIRRLILTDQGRALYPVVNESFGRIAEVAGKLRHDGESRILTVSITPAFGAKWLIHHLPRFWAQHPEIDLRIHHSIQTTDLRHDDVDVAIRFGAGRWEGLISEFLLRVDYIPVCSPALLDGKNALRRPSDLRHHTLLHEDDHDGWIQWLAVAGVTDIDPRRGPIIDDATVILHAAAEGQGVALGRTSLIAEDLETGRLVKPFDLTVLSDLAYHLVYLPGALESPKVKAFRDFLVTAAHVEPADV